jgi:hypothetical protein
MVTPEKRIDSNINVENRIRTGVKVEVRKAVGKKPIRVYRSKQQLGKDGKEAKIEIMVDREKGTYFQNVEQQDQDGTWKQVHHEEETLEEHNRKKRQKSGKAL